MEGVGLVDGETMERLWSYLRKFSKISKEMTPAHRMEQLTYALQHYARRKTCALGKNMM
jgi:Kyakuja-Dileera-Zisupton transposase